MQSEGKRPRPFNCLCTQSLTYTIYLSLCNCISSEIVDSMRQELAILQFIAQISSIRLIASICAQESFVLAALQISAYFVGGLVRIEKWLMFQKLNSRGIQLSLWHLRHYPCCMHVLESLLHFGAVGRIYIIDDG